MSLGAVFSQIGTSGDGPKSFTEMLFREFQARKISKDDYETQNAIWVAENAKEYQAKRYPVLSQRLIDYAHGRINGSIQARGHAEHRALGLWVQSMISLMEQNTSDREFLVWCLNKLRSKGLQAQVTMIEHQLAGFDLPISSHLKLALECQRIDSQAKTYQERTR